MTTKATLTAAATALGLVLLATLLGSSAPESPSRVRISRMRAYMTAQADSLNHAMDAFATGMEHIHSRKDVLRSRHNYETVRRSYKRLEPLLDYLDPEYMAQHINGAPLPRLDRKSQFVEVLQPQGLQIVDEMLFEDADRIVHDATIHAELRAKVTTLRSSLREMLASMARTPWSERMLIEAARSGVMRITALGITGFDRPGSDPTTSDDIQALATIATIAEGYRTAGEDKGRKGAARACSLASACTNMMRKATSFDAMDRATLIRTGLDPLFGALLDIQLQAQIELSTEVSTSEPAVQPTARSMFSSATLNPYRSTGVGKAYRTDAMRELGRTLFFDPALSTSNERACASCHQPERAFTDGQAKSMAMGKQGTIDRNTPTLVNVVYANRFFMDLRAMKLDDVIQHVITHEKEFGSTVLDAIGRLRASDEYQHLFATAFGDASGSAISIGNIGTAIASYLASLTTFDAPIDRYLRGEAVSLTAPQRRGFNLFMGRAACGTCHFAPTFSGLVPPSYTESESEVLAVATRPDTVRATLDPDIGRAGGIMREGTAIYYNSFKTPTVRNIALTAPYMHNGAYPALEDVMKFYELGGGRGIGITHPHQTLAPDRIVLTRKDHADMIAFLNILTDTSGTTARPTHLPRLGSAQLSRRTIGGDY